MPDTDAVNAVVAKSLDCPECIEATDRKLRSMTDAEKAARSDPVLAFCQEENQARYEAAMARCRL
jgi:hypothetical protein